MSDIFKSGLAGLFIVVAAVIGFGAGILGKTRGQEIIDVWLYGASEPGERMIRVWHDGLDTGWRPAVCWSFSQVEGAVDQRFSVQWWERDGEWLSRTGIVLNAVGHYRVRTSRRPGFTDYATTSREYVSGCWTVGVRRVGNRGVR